MHDMDAKGRRSFLGRPKGEAHHKAKLTEKDIADIRVAYSVRIRGTVRSLAEKYGLNRQTINRVALHKAWTHV